MCLTASIVEVHPDETVLILSKDEMELFHNLLYSGVRWRNGRFPQLASDLLESFDNLRGEIDEDDELFDGEHSDGSYGLAWKRTE